MAALVSSFARSCAPPKAIRDVYAGKSSLRNQMLDCRMIERDADEDIERKGEAEGHGEIEAGVGFGHGGLHHGRDGDIRRAGAEDGEEEGVALVEAEEHRDEDARRRPDEGEDQSKLDREVSCVHETRRLLAEARPDDVLARRDVAYERLVGLSSLGRLAPPARQISTQAGDLEPRLG
jgi:hypothetical protein